MRRLRVNSVLSYLEEPLQVARCKPVYIFDPTPEGMAMFCSRVTPRVLILVASFVFLPAFMVLPVSSTTPFGHETVDATGFVGHSTSLGLDTQGNPHISYWDLTSFDLKYAVKTGGSWPSSGQSVRPLELGLRIRLKTTHVVKHFYGERIHASEWIVGTLVLMDEHFISVQLADQVDSLSIRRDSIAVIERSVPSSRRGLGQFVGLVVGVPAGGALGIYLAHAQCDERGELLGCLGEGIAGLIVGVAIGGWAGIKLGGNIGSKIKHETWKPVWGQDPALSLGVQAFPMGEGLRAAVVLSF